MTPRTKGITGVLYDMLKQAVEAMRRNLKRNDKNSSGELYRSLKASVEVKEQFEYDAQITTTADYYDFVDKGVRGHGRGRGPAKKPMKAAGSPYQFKVGPPVRAFADWIKTKPVMAQPSAAYPMAKSAGRYGMSGSGFIDEGVKAAMDQKNIDALTAAYIQAFEDQLNIITGDGNS